MDALLLFVVLVPLCQMLFGRGPNNIRKLMRLDLAAFLVLLPAWPWRLRLSEISTRSKPPAFS
jgi:hypothetical protein